MRPSLRSPRGASSIPILVLGLLLLGAPSAAHAWTDANVRSARAYVQVDREAAARVALEVRVQVLGGWLEGLEIAGLDPDLVLDPAKAPYFVGDDGSKHVVKLSVKPGGRLLLSWKRHEAPRRGSYTLGIVYRTDLAHRSTEALDDGGILVRWTLPAWQSGLDGVVVTMELPSEHARSAAGSSASGFSEERQVAAGRTLLTFRRPHLPRTMAWTLGASLPPHELANALYAPRPIAHPEPEVPLGEEAPYLALYALAALLSVLLVFKRTSFAAVAARAGYEPVSVLAIPSELARASFAIGASLLFAFSLEESPLLAALLLIAAHALCMVRGTRALRPSTEGRWELATLEDRRRAARKAWLEQLAPRAFLDATTPAGVVGFGAAVLATSFCLGLSPYADVVPTATLTAAAALAPIWLTATRLHLPPSPEAALSRLTQVARAMRAKSSTFALALMVRRAPTGELEAARIAVVQPHPPEGLERLEIAFADHGRGARGGALYVVAIARAGSSAVHQLLMHPRFEGAYDSRAGTHTATWIRYREGEDPTASHADEALHAHAKLA